MTAKELKASILDLAIRGKLVPQDPNDEPAENLLARIAAEKAKLVKSGKLKKGKPLPPITDDDKPFGLPRGWVWCRLGEVLAMINVGIVIRPTRYYTQSKEGILAFRNTNVGEGFVEETDWVRVTKQGLEENQRCVLHGNDVAIARSGRPGIACLISSKYEGCAAIDILIATPNQEIVDPKYLMHCINTQFSQHQLTGMNRGIAQSHVGARSVVNMIMTLPPLSEQKRIVEKIEQLMPLVERYGQAEEKRRHLIATLPEALKKSILKSAFDTGFDAACVFEEKTLADACADVFTGNSLSDAEKRRFTTETGLPYIGTKDVGFDQVVDYDNGIRIPASEDKYRTAATGSTLLCVEGGSSGRKIALLDRDVRFGNKLCAFVPSKGVDAHYLFLFLQSPQFLEQFAALQNGPRKGAGVLQVKKLMIRYVPLAEQKRIVEKIEEFLAVLTRMS